MKKMIAIVAVLLGITLLAGAGFAVRDMITVERINRMAGSPAWPSAHCPFCGEWMTPIIYGYPDMNMGESASRGEIMLGGCCVSGHDPAFYCRNCKHRFYKDLEPAE